MYYLKPIIHDNANEDECNTVLNVIVIVGTAQTKELLPFRTRTVRSCRNKRPINLDSASHADGIKLLG